MMYNMVAVVEDAVEQIVIGFTAEIILFKQGVALTGRNTTGPTLHMRESYRRRETPATVTSLTPTLYVGRPVIT